MICLFLVASLSLGMQTPPDQWRKIQLQRHVEILENYGIGGTGDSANKFLNSLFPNSQVRIEIDQLIQRLSSPTYLAREQAEKELVARGPSALTQLINATKNGDTETRSRAQRCISGIQSTHQQLVKSAIEVLRLDESENPSHLDRLKTIFLLIRNMKEHRRQLLDAPRTFVDNTCVETIQNGLKDPDVDIRIACVRGFARMLFRAGNAGRSLVD